MALTKHIKPIDIPNNFILNSHSFISFILPEDGINLYYPGATGWTFVGNSNGPSILSDDTLFNTSYTWAIPTVNNQVMYTPIHEKLEANKPYTLSLWLKKASEISEVEFFIATGNTDYNSGPTIFTPVYAFKSITATDFWDVYEATFYTSNYDPNSYYYIIMRFPNKGEFYVDGVQLEQKEYRTTYITGEYAIIENDSNYRWKGQRYNSPSIRMANIKGGRIVPFDEIGFELMAVEGLGLPNFSHNLVELPVNPIALYEGSIPEQRDIKIDFITYAKDVTDLLRRRRELVQQLKSGIIQLQIQLFHCNTPLSTIFEFTALYDGGAELKLDTLYGEKISLDFTTFDPYLYRIGNNVTLYGGQEFGTSAGIARINGEWVNLNAPYINIQVGEKTIVGNDNNLYYLRQNPNALEVVLSKYDGVTWTAVIATRLNGQFFTDMVAVGNYIYIVGDFDQMSGIGEFTVNNCNFARYNITNGHVEPLSLGMTLASGASGILISVLLSNNKLFLGGKFDSITNFSSSPTTLVTNCMVIYDINSNTFQHVTNGGLSNSTGVIYTALEYNNGVYVGGLFNDTYGTNILYVNNLNLPFNSRIKISLGGADGLVSALVKTKTNEIYIGGQFSRAGRRGPFDLNVENYNNGNTPVSIGRIIPNKFDIVGLDGGVLNACSNTAQTSTSHLGIVYDMEVDNNGILWVVGNFDYFGPLIENGFGVTNNTLLEDASVPNQFDCNCSSIAEYDTITKQWKTPSIFYTVKPIIHDVMTVDTERYKLKNDIELVITANGPYIANTNITVNIPNDAAATFPLLVVIGDFFKNVRLKSIINKTTNTQLYFDTLLAPLEEYMIDLRGLVPEVNSSIYGLQNGQLLYGSNAKQFMLVPGENQLEVSVNLWGLSSISTVTLLAVYKNKYLSLDSIFNMVNTINEY